MSFSASDAAQEHGYGAFVRSRVQGTQHSRKNPEPTVLEEKGEGVVLIAHGEPHDQCPVAGCDGGLRFAHR